MAAAIGVPAVVRYAVVVARPLLYNILYFESEWYLSYYGMRHPQLL